MVCKLFIPVSYTHLEDEKEFNTFPFSTVQKDVNLNVNYVNGAVQSNVYFEVYDEMPVVESEYGTYTKRQDVNYLFAAYTLSLIHIF